MRGVWLPNIKRWLSGTLVGGEPSINVNVLNTVPVPVAPANYQYKERRFHIASSTNINARTGAWIELDANSDVAAGTPADVANTIAEFRANWNGAGALEFGVGANAGAVTPIDSIGSGQTQAVGVSLSAGNKIWVRAVKNTAITSGELMILLLG